MLSTDKVMVSCKR